MSSQSETEKTGPQPELGEPRLTDPGLSDLSGRDRVAILVRAAKEALNHGITDAAAAIAYYVFLALPAVVLVTLGLFGLLAGDSAINTILDRIGTAVPEETVTLLNDSLTRLTENSAGSLAMVIVGIVLAIWTASGAMAALTRALNRAYDRDESRGFVRLRITALGMLLLVVVAFVLTFGLLVLGPYASTWVGDAVGMESVVGWVWWTAQWPILLVGLLVVFAGLLHLGPDVDHPRWRFVTPGAVLAVILWLAASGLFAVYVSRFGSYNKSWGSLAAVIVMLTWLWLSGIVLLLGAEVNAEAERSRELRRGEPASVELQAPTKNPSR